MIKKIAIVSKRKIDESFKKSIKKVGFKYSNSKPDIVISLGGDGTYFYAERKFPGIPKLLVRDSRICNKCDLDSFEKDILERLKKGKYRIKENLKLEAVVKGKKFTCTNDFVIRNKFQTRALRFRVEINGKPIDNVLIGDGVVIATPFGSTGYFQSITRKSFKKGIGIAFNNMTKQVKYRIVDENSRTLVEMVRDRAIFSSDNDTRMAGLKKNDVIKIRKSKQVARLIDISSP